ncbi:unnamed protein product [Nesidiocoris tenuis]|uniref:Uncharacterized protein n=1 Tax=Nesidiocoris tenuis TaxID=355587 RepID=A0A6H5GDD7_9HEMI|nr:unnamed protein product [Nesidiocoris tenuis]
MRSYQQVATDVNEALAIDEIISAWENLNSRFACGMRTEPRLTHQFPFHMSRRPRKSLTSSSNKSSSFGFLLSLTSSSI